MKKIYYYINIIYNIVPPPFILQMLKNSIKQGHKSFSGSKRFISSTPTKSNASTALKTSAWIIGTLGAVASSYSLAVYLAHKDPNFNKWVIENIPYSDRLLRSAEILTGYETIQEKVVAPPPKTIVKVVHEPVKQVVPEVKKVKIDFNNLRVQTDNLSSEMKEVCFFYNQLLNYLSSHSIEIQEHDQQELQLYLSGAKSELEKLISLDPYQKEFDSKLGEAKKENLRILTNKFNELQEKLDARNKQKFTESLNNFDKIASDRIDSVLTSAMVLQIRDFQKIIKNRVESFHNDELKNLNQLEETTYALGPQVDLVNYFVKENTAKSKMFEELSELTNKLLSSTIQPETLKQALSHLGQYNDFVRSSISNDCKCSKCKSAGVCTCKCKNKTSITKAALIILNNEASLNLPLLSSQELLSEFKQQKVKIIEGSLIDQEKQGIIPNLLAKIGSYSIMNSSAKNPSSKSLNDDIVSKLNNIETAINQKSLDDAILNLQSLPNYGPQIASDFTEKLKRHLTVKYLVDAIDADLRSWVVFCHLRKRS